MNSRKSLVMLPALLLGACAQAAELAPSSLPQESARPFTMSSLRSTYPLAGALRGSYSIARDTLVVTVTKGELRSHIPRDYQNRGSLDNLSVRVALGSPTATGWTLEDSLGTEIRVADTLGPEAYATFANLRFTLPIKPGTNLGERWLVFQFSADHRGLFNRPAGRFANYACSEENLLGPTEASKARAIRMIGEYSRVC